MIQPNELRLGNYVSQLGAVCRVVAVSNIIYGSVYIVQLGDARSEGFTSESIDPIPLSNDWLVRFGFCKTVLSSYMTGVEIKYSAFELKGFVYNSIQRTWWYRGVLEKQPKSVHQLQNLFFALTGEELKLNEKQ